MATHSSVLAWRIPGAGVGCHLWGRTESDTTEPLTHRKVPTQVCCCCCCCCCCQVASVVSNSVRPHRRQPTRLPRPWDSPSKNAGVGCHFLLQCMKVKSESEVAQSCPTLSNPMDCSLPGSPIHGIFQARELEWGAIAFSTEWCSTLQPMDCSTPGFLVLQHLPEFAQTHVH